MCKHLDRISVALSAAIVLGTAALTPAPAEAFSNTAQRTIVVYKPVPTIVVYRAVPTASKSGGTNAGASSSAIAAAETLAMC